MFKIFILNFLFFNICFGFGIGISGVALNRCTLNYPGSTVAQTVVCTYQLETSDGEVFGDPVTNIHSSKCVAGYPNIVKVPQPSGARTSGHPDEHLFHFGVEYFNVNCAAGSICTWMGGGSWASCRPR